MIEQVFHYAVIRYRPLPELAEFANIGVVVFEPERGAVSYKLAPTRFRRVTQFFDNIESGAYSETIRYLDGELSGLSMLAHIRHSETARQLFSSFVSKREGVIAFSAVRSIVGRNNDVGIAVAERLYDRFVRRNLDQIPQREAGMVKEIRDQLRQAGFKSFKTKQIDDEIMPVKLPLVSEFRELYVIKPLAFDQKTTLGVMDHANIWRDRFDYLIERGKLQRENIHIAIEQPDAEDDDRLAEAFVLARQQILKLNVDVSDYVPSENEYVDDAIVRFAARKVGSEGRLARW